MIPGGTYIRVVSAFYAGRRAVKNRIIGPMAAIAVPAGQSGTIIPLEVVPATDGSGTYVLVVSLQNANIDVGTVDVALNYNRNLAHSKRWAEHRIPKRHHGKSKGYAC